MTILTLSWLSTNHKSASIPAPSQFATTKILFIGMEAEYKNILLLICTEIRICIGTHGFTN